MADAKNYPILATKELVVFPSSSVPLTVNSDRNVHAIEAALADSGLILLVPVKERKHPRQAKLEDLYAVGTLCKIEQARGSLEEGYQMIVGGLYRCDILSTEEKEKLFVGEASRIEATEDIDEQAKKTLLDSAKSLALEILKLSRGSGVKRLAELIQGLDDEDVLVHTCAAHLDLNFEDRLDLLEIRSVKQRLLRIIELLQIKKNSMNVQLEINRKLSTQMDKKQREVILREQLLAIREELGELDASSPKPEYLERIEASEMPDTVKAVARDEAKRLESMPAMSPEGPSIRNYLDLLLELPWTHQEATDIDIRHARKILNEDHYGLDKVKDRIIQHLAVMQLNRGMKGSILLLVGPPGVGKTSLGKSIAKAMHREFVRVSLGGVRDEADIRGHRRTYLGSMPGRLIQGIKRARCTNPVFLLDEIDKLGRSWSGDPAGALLEVLDPEQNQNFEDHYLDVPYDLSQVMFIATANSLEGIPGPLRDRLELIQLSGYTSAEKLHIAKQHLWPSERNLHGLAEAKVSIQDEALLRLITHYTREAGVRDLKRKLAAICRHLSEKVILQEGEKSFSIRTEDLEDILGPEPFRMEVAEALLPAGVVTGLAWTPMGGDILFIEAKQMRGKGQLTITGQLGDVMKESLHIAMSHIRYHLAEINPRFDYEKRDIHVHVPSGAIPKDGPSAGITMLTSLASLIAGKAVSPDLAMSGEITLRGTVMPVGGVKEKVIAAHNAGIKRIILASRNRKDLREVPEEVRQNLKFYFVDTVEQVLQIALEIDIDGSKPQRIFNDETKLSPSHEEQLPN